MASRRSLYGLDGLNFFMATVQTGFGPFISVYLTGQKWTQSEIGLALSVGTVAAMVSQLPAGALVDAVPDKRLLAGLAIIGVAASALLLAVFPNPLPVLLSQALHGFASTVIGPILAALALALVGIDAMGLRLGRNARFGAIGNALAAAVMGAVGTYVSERAVFLLTALLALPTLLALGSIKSTDIVAHGARAGHIMVRERAHRHRYRRVLRDRRLLVFGACVVLFHLANAAMLPLAAAEVTRRAGAEASLLIAASIVVPQLVVAIISPGIGQGADRWGRRAVLLLGFAALPLRGLLFAFVAAPWAVVGIELFDGLSAAMFGVLLPLVAADITRGTGRFNLVQGALGLAVGLGATISTIAAGWIFDRWGHEAAFLALSAVGLVATLAIALLMPETRPKPRRSRAVSHPALQRQGDGADHG